jgi:DNA-binding FadR family transcriptional regulator
MQTKREPIRKISLVDQIAMQLREEIIAGKYVPGGHFPGEKELTFRFAASRNTVRSALQKLANEGLVGIEHGRSNTVKNYKTAIGIDVFPELILASPRSITPDVFKIYRQYIQWIHDKIILSSVEKVQPADKPTLIEMAECITDRLTAEEYWKHSTRLFRKLLEISDNVLLMMHYNSYINMQERLQDLGVFKLPSKPPAFKHMMFKNLVEAICSHDTDKVNAAIAAMTASHNDSFKRMFPGS